jgi:hypothetical protein
MRKVIAIGIAAGLLLLAGCNGMVRDHDERKAMYAQTIDSDMRQLVDDWDSFWLADRTHSRLTEWYTR